MNFQQFINILRSRKWIVLLALLMTVITTLVVSLLLPKQYVATTSIVVDQKGVDTVTGLALPIQLLPGYMATQVGVITSHNVARKVVEKLKLSDNPEMQKDFAKAKSTGDIGDWVADSLLKKLEARPSRESSLIELDFTSSDPQLAANIVNAFANAYIQTKVDLRAQPAKLSADWFDSQMASLRGRLEHAQSLLSTYQQQEGIVDSLGLDRLDIEKNRLADLSRQLVESQVRTNELQSRKDLLASTLKHGGSLESLQEVLNSPLIQGLKTELAQRKVHLAELSQKFKKASPIYKQAEAQVIVLQQEIQSAIKMVLNSIGSGVTSSKQRDEILTNALAQQKTKVLELKKKQDQNEILKHEVENAQKSYDDVMQRTVQTRMESELSQTDISILNPALPPQKPAKPAVLLNMILSIFLGGMLGVGTALLVESKGRRVRSAYDVSELLAVPVFAVISATAARPKRIARLNSDKPSDGSSYRGNV